ncbi:hypothetical protein NDU88_001847, partial [Pleurodeles waltl]
LPLSALQAITQKRAELELRDWLEAGVNTLGTLFENNKLKSFETLRAQYDIPAKHFLTYGTIRASIGNHWRTKNSEPSAQDMCTYLASPTPKT